MTGRTRPLGLIPGLLDLAERQCGVVSRAQLSAHGVTRHHVRSQVTAQRWQEVGHHVIALMTGPLDIEQLRWSAWLHAGARACLHARSSLALHGLQGWPEERTEVLVPHGSNVSAFPSMRVRRSRHIPASDLCERQHLPCTTVERATLDAASYERSSRSASGLALAVIQARLTTPSALLIRLEQDEGPRRHASAIRAALADARAGADSNAEVDVTRLLHRAGLHSYRRQVQLDTPYGRRRVDLLVDLPDGRLLAIEVDGVHHADPAVRAADAEKDAALLAAGIRVLRIPVTWLRSHPDRVLAQLIAIRVGSENAR